MIPLQASNDWDAVELVETIRHRLSEGKRIRRTLPGGGRIHMDRSLPFLCVYRKPLDRWDPGTKRLVEGEASFLIVADMDRSSKRIRTLVRGIMEAMAARFGAFLIVEIWSAPDAHVAAAVPYDAIEPAELRPNFTIHGWGQQAPQRTLTALRRGLEKISFMKQQSAVHVDLHSPVHPADMAPIVTRRDAKRLACDQIGICIRPIYRDRETDEVYPEVLRAMKRGLGRALKRGFFIFAKTHTNEKPAHVFSLGRRAMVKAVWDIDRRLAEIADSFDFILQITPVNVEAAWYRFRRNHFEEIPKFYYRPLSVEPAILKRRLYEVPIERIEDPTLGDLFRERQDELDRKITMLTDIDTPRFLLGSQQIYGSVDASLLSTAMELLAGIPSTTREDSRGGYVGARTFADRAREEIGHYRDQMPGFAAQAIVRNDMFSGLLCSGGHLFIGHQTKIPSQRVHALLQHEVGTHLLTYYNGLAEPFHQLHSGFAGYDALQEGLAVLTEYLVGGLSRPRIRILAARVVATQQVIDGATFIDTYRYLWKDLGFAQRVAYTIVMRTCRGGGLTKDAIYLRGLLEILEYLASGGSLEPILVGKIAVDHIPLIRELLQRKILRPAVLQPRYLSFPESVRCLENLRAGVRIIDIVKRASS